ncbi:MAG: PQQ-binding-like beta-propeller repeat protein [Patescibacteria group bacterium]
MKSKYFYIIILIIIILVVSGFLVYKNFYDSVTNELGEEQDANKIIPEEKLTEEIILTEEISVSTGEKLIVEEMSCEEYCEAKTHDDCVGYWEISGAYSNCLCNYKCETVDREETLLKESESEQEEPQVPEEKQTILGPQTDWFVFQGNSARTGMAESVIPQKPNLVWQLTVGDFRAKGIDPREINRPIVYNNKIFVSASEVTGLDLATGNFLWHYKEEGLYPSNIATGDGKVFVIFNNSSLLKNMTQGFIYALDEKTGDFLWKYQTQKSISHSTPLFEAEKVFVGDDSGNLYALNSKTGELIWKKFLDADTIHSSPSFYKDIVFVGTEGTGTFSSRLFALDAETGNEIWKFQVDFISGKLNIVHGTPVISDDVVYFGSENGYFYALAYDSGELVWKKKIAVGDKFMCGVSAPAVLNETKIFVTTWEGNLFSLNQEDGEILWQKNFDTSGQRGDAVAITGSGLVCITINEKFSCLNENSGEIVWQKQFFGGTSAAASGVLIVPSIGTPDSSPESTPILLIYN